MKEATITSIPTHQPTDDLARALAATGTLVAGTTPRQWSAPTGCPDWTVRQLVDHMVTGNLRFAALLTDAPPPDPAADHLGDDPAAGYQQAARTLVAAFSRPGVFQRVLQLPRA